MRRPLSLLALPLALGFLAGCGAKYELPTERPRDIGVPSDKSYQMIATWTGMTGIQDVLLTQGTGTQLFLLFNDGAFIDPAGAITSHGSVGLYPLSRPTPIVGDYFQPLSGLFNPIAVASAQNKLFVLDAGDSCMAHWNDTLMTCRANTDPARKGNFIRNLSAYWRVREYGLGGGDTVSTFTDTTFATVAGVAAGEDGYVYVSGQAIVLDTLETDQRIRTRQFVSRIYRYARGPKYPGAPNAQDVNMPGSNWHRDTTWVIEDGSGNSTVFDPAGIYWTRSGSHPVYVADRGNSKVKGLSSMVTNLGLVQTDGSTTGSNFVQPTDVFADLSGFFYVVDRGNRRVLRFDANSGEYIQRVDNEPNAQSEELLDPVAVAVDDSLAYIADRGRGKVIRFKRRP
ncbi:MAG: hypothetical protein KAY61_05175 [Candidatus Eisenbacteria bacterium]|nr:hypothetical protein [Candidatus Eisenbacteria bacterium]